ncbi:MAG: YtxH domain-containing protein [Acidobacteriota bacterium]|nr:YtxH domain-containing protein [Acidobacteriota bacterium]
MGNFLLGFGIGITVGVLFAPKAGPESREFLGSKAGEGTDYLLKQGQQLKESAADLLDRGKTAVLNQKDKVMGTADQAAQPFQA